MWWRREIHFSVRWDGSLLQVAAQYHKWLAIAKTHTSSSGILQLISFFLTPFWVCHMSYSCFIPCGYHATFSEWGWMPVSGKHFCDDSVITDCFKTPFQTGKFHPITVRRSSPHWHEQSAGAGRDTDHVWTRVQQCTYRCQRMWSVLDYHSGHHLIVWAPLQPVLLEQTHCAYSKLNFVYFSYRIASLDVVTLPWGQCL